MATTTKQDGVRELQRTLYRTAKAAIARDGRMPAVKDVGEPCAGEPHARFEVAAGGNRNQSAIVVRNWAPPADPTRGRYPGGNSPFPAKVDQRNELPAIRSNPHSYRDPAASVGEQPHSDEGRSRAVCARPSRRVFIPKADGRQRPLGVAALEDKLLQRAVVEVL